jgi:hypothetical protein
MFKNRTQCCTYSYPQTNEPDWTDVKSIWTGVEVGSTSFVLETTDPLEVQQRSAGPKAYAERTEFAFRGTRVLTTCAEEFGQEDDLTILTLSYAVVPVPA